MPRSSSFALMLALGLAAPLAGCDRESGGNAQQEEQGATIEGSEFTGTLDRSFAGSAMPAKSFPDPAGKTLEFASLKGTPVLLNLWATWCAPCVVEMPMLDNLAGDYGARLRVITVSQDQKGAEVVTPLFAEKKFKHLEPWMDSEMDLSFELTGGGSLPTTILYDAAGKEVWRVVGGYDWSSAKARGAIDEGLAGTPSASDKAG